MMMMMKRRRSGSAEEKKLASVDAFKFTHIACEWRNESSCIIYVDEDD